MGAWVRAVVSEMLGAEPAGRRPGDLPRVTVPETNRAAVDELRRVGNNLNQLARSANTQGRIEDVDELRRVLLQVEDALRLVRGQRPPRVVAPRTNVGDPPVPAGPVPVDEHQAADTTVAAVPRPRRRWFGAGAAR